MNNNDMYNFLDTQQQALTEEKLALVESTRVLISQYWDWFNAQNTRISELRKVGDTTLNVSNIAPVIEVKSSYSKNDPERRDNVYILWKNHNPLFRTNLFKKHGTKINASKPLHKHDSEHIVSILKKKCTWDAERAIELEGELDQIRIAISGMHQAIVRLRSSKRRILKKQSKINHDETSLEENGHDD